MQESVLRLAEAIAAGSATTNAQIIAAMRGLFGTRYYKASGPHVDQERPPFIRNAYGKGGEEPDHVAYGGFINPENPPIRARFLEHGVLARLNEARPIQLLSLQ
jgi:hypothetical protein